jgi:hypothetical protein
VNENVCMYVCMYVCIFMNAHMYTHILIYTDEIVDGLSIDGLTDAQD